MRNLPFREFEHNRVWLAIVQIAHDLIIWMKRLLFTGTLARSEPKRLRYRILHVAGRLAFHARSATLRVQAGWPWATERTGAFERLAGAPSATRLTPPAACPQTQITPTRDDERSVPASELPVPRSATRVSFNKERMPEQDTPGRPRLSKPENRTSNALLQDPG